MARAPNWYDQLDSILATLGAAEDLDWLGRAEVGALFGTSERDSIRLLHKFGAIVRNDALSLPREALLVQLEAVAAGSAYAAYRRQREGVAQHLAQARTETAARQFRARAAFPEVPRPRLDALPSSLTWRRAVGQGPGRFEILYEDGADLMAQLAEFLHAAGANREEFFEGTEPEL
ncbi:MAG: hypothetical protein IM674_13265 [Brevundimonas sp.]|jgi:hypothetical protein|nr:hypothetical protein [Acidobacteriaceae bacterium]MCA3719208.1 hypothetical protein [Brevundimonas sp.]